MSAKYRTEGVNHHGADGLSAITGGLEIAVASPLRADRDLAATNPEQLLALAWATCLNATAQAIVGKTRRTAVRVEVELHDADPGPGLEFRVEAYLSAEGADQAETERILTAAHARCPVSKLLQGATTLAVHTEPYA